MNSEEEIESPELSEVTLQTHRGYELFDPITPYSLFISARDTFEIQHSLTLHFMYDKMKKIIQQIDPQFISFSFEDFLDFCLLVSDVTIAS